MKLSFDLCIFNFLNLEMSCYFIFLILVFIIKTQFLINSDTIGQ